uniref:Putative transport protein n=1 Tax=Netrium digitus TaxID=43946 RepID=A0A191T4Z5_9VIRI|nr:putative transport protein [Netrium digitus]ANI25473.1 putative transport protein [Netrium digitus]
MKNFGIHKIITSILVYKISKLINNVPILDRVSLYVPKASLSILLGPSGSGKSSLLRMIAGLDTPTNGSIWLNGRDATHIPVQYRRMGFVFQNYALFNHMTVKENIFFGLRLRTLGWQQIESRINYLLDSLRIKDIASQYPSQLSGGQKQRVALARSLAIQPEFLLLDEPFGALDGELRRHLNKWFKHYLKSNKITTIMVTHDQKEAVSMADEILILREGRLAQQAEPRILYDQPIDRFVGKFLGPLIEAPKKIESINKKIPSTSEQLKQFAIDPVWAFTFGNRSIDKYDFFLGHMKFTYYLKPKIIHLKLSLNLLFTKKLNSTRTFCRTFLVEPTN